MKRIIGSAIVLTCVVLAGLLTLPLVVSSKSIRQHLTQRIQELTTGQITYQGEPVLSFRPYMGVELVNVVVTGKNAEDDSGDWLRMEKLQFEVKLLPLLLGRTRFTNVKMIRPRIKLPMSGYSVADFKNVLKDHKNQNSSNSAEKSDREPTQTETPPDIVLGQFEIVDGIIELGTENSEPQSRLSNLHATVNWPSLTSSWKIGGQGIWRGEAFSFTNDVEKPLVFFTSGKSTLSIKFNSPALTASFDGNATMLSDIQLAGNASIATPSMPRLYELLSEKQPTDIPSLGNFRVEGKISANVHEIQFDESKIILGTNEASGNLIIRQNKQNRPKISGTLAFNSLDITPFAEVFSNKQPPKAESHATPVKPNPFDYDIRFSAQDYQFQENSFGTLAATLMLTKHEWAVDIGEADFYDGTIIGSISSKLVKNDRETELKGNLHNISMGKIARELYGGEIVTTGEADVKFNLKAPGKAQLGNFREYYGSMKVTVTNGQIEGVDLVKAIPALIRNNGFVTIDEIKGETPFDNLALEMLIYNGVGWITKGNATGEKNEFRISGKTDLIRGSLAVYTDISRKASADKPAQQARIFIGGTVKNPLVTRSPLAKLRPVDSIPKDG